MDETRTELRQYILREFLPGEEACSLEDTTPLISGGILDSLSTLKMVAFLEDHYDIRIEVDEVDTDHLDTIADIATLVASKQ